MFNVAVCTPSAGRCEFQYAMSLANLVRYFCTHAVYEGENEQGIQIAGQQSFSTSCNREMLVDAVLASKDNFSHLLFIDDDMRFDRDCLHLLASRREDFVVGNYPRKTTPLSYIAIGLDEEELPMPKGATGIVEAKQVGFGFALIKLELFKYVEKPWFPLPYSTTTKQYGSEDYWFCHQARKLGYRVFVDYDVSRKIGHMGSWEYKWEDKEEDEKRIIEV